MVKLNITGIVKLLLLGVLLLVMLPESKAQNLNSNAYSSRDLSNVNVDDLTDAQVSQMYQQAQQMGLSDQEILNQALQRGLPPDQVSKLQTRFQQLQTGSSKSTPNSGMNGKGTDINTRRNQQNKNSTLSGRDSSRKAVQDVFYSIKPRIFGEELFNNSNLTFEPNLRIATPENYIIGPDDQILIDIYGYSDFTYNLTVSPEGTIRIPRVGPVFVSGLSIKEAAAQIRTRLAKTIPGMRGSSPVTFVRVNIGNIRSIKVTMLGEIRQPGTYTLPSLATVFNAIYSSGGPSENGSFRNIQLIRANKVIKTIDIYDFLMKGDQGGNVQLRDQDVIKINPYDARVQFLGEFKRPGIYELKGAESLQKILGYAGGFTDKAYTHLIKVIRYDGREKTAQDIADTQFPVYTARRADKYYADTVLNRFSNRVQITGAVFRPGFYALGNGLTISGLIKKADGLKGEAYSGLAIIRRYREDNFTELLSFNIDSVLKGRSADIKLKREDSVIIGSRISMIPFYTVSIGGEVKKPDTLPWSYNMKLGDLLFMSGGLTDAATLKRVEVVRRVKNSDPLIINAVLASVFRFDMDSSFAISDSGKNFRLQPYDKVFVRSLPGYQVQQFASVEGEILYPGTYGLKQKNMRISDLIRAAGGITVSSFTQGATLIRKKLVNRFEEQKRRTQIKHLLANPADSLAALASVRDENQNPAEAVGIDLQKILLKNSSKYDLILMDGDTLKIPKLLQTVNVQGEVLYPVQVRYDRSISLRKYISQAGGFSPRSVRRRTYIVYANGSVRSTSKFLFFNNYPAVGPGSQIFVPQKDLSRKPFSIAELLGITSGLASIAIVFVTIFRK